MLLTDVDTNGMYKITIIVYLEICKKHVLPKKYPRKHQIPIQNDYDERKIKIAKENTEVKKSSNQRKCTKSDLRN